MKIHGKITYTVDAEQPDIQYIKGWSENKILNFLDIFTFDDCFTFEYIENYVKSDLSLIAGGGYNSEHIHNVNFEISRI